MTPRENGQQHLTGGAGNKCGSRPGFNTEHGEQPDRGTKQRETEDAPEPAHPRPRPGQPSHQSRRGSHGEEGRRHAEAERGEYQSNVEWSARQSESDAGPFPYPGSYPTNKQTEILVTNLLKKLSIIFYGSRMSISCWPHRVCCTSVSSPRPP
jgi:hypothetical protein